MKLKLSDFSSIAEIVGAIAIVASLIFVGVQIQQNTRATQLAAAGEMTTALIEVNKATLDSELAELFQRSVKEGFSSLNATEQEQLGSLHFMYFRSLQGFYYQYEQGALDPKLWEPHRVNIRETLSAPGTLQWWESVKDSFYIDFVAYIDAEVVRQNR